MSSQEGVPLTGLAGWTTFPFHPDDADWEKKIENAARAAAGDLRG